ncbi:Nickel uptake substrate-specific transmembrane region [Bremerella volcania]|uniref:Nickel uptake substrate-specific transmembrane region n=2 Tax=Bremerella volcania TaxID=2527984 RepID=A0A518CBH4_9BACT|nr:Nickel uptake substrate-specific transmembrane region [Bremerella volcania]
MRQRHSCHIVLAAMFVVTIVAGCNQSNLPKTERVTGQVLYKGSPVDNATVIFSRGSRNIANGEIALGKTDAQGNFSLTTHLSGQSDVSGAIAGTYQVTVSKKVPPPGMTQAEYDAKVEAVNQAAQQGSVQPPGMELPPLVEMFPRKYSSSSATELTADVKVNENNEFSFDLK